MTIPKGAVDCTLEFMRWLRVPSTRVNAPIHLLTDTTDESDPLRYTETVKGHRKTFQGYGAVEEAGKALEGRMVFVYEVYLLLDYAAFLADVNRGAPIYRFERETPSLRVGHIVAWWILPEFTMREFQERARRWRTVEGLSGVHNFNAPDPCPHTTNEAVQVCSFKPESMGLRNLCRCCTACRDGECVYARLARQT